MEGHNSDIAKLVSQKEKAERQANIDEVNASLAKLRGDNEAAKQLMKSCRQNRQTASNKQDEIDNLLQENQEECEVFDLKEEIQQYYLDPIQSALEAFENDQVDEFTEDLNVEDLKLVVAVLQSILLEEDGKDHIYDVIRSARTENFQEDVSQEDVIQEDDSIVAVVDQEEEIDQEEDDLDQEEDDDDGFEDEDEIDSEIENEIYGEMENELGYDFNDDDDDDD